LISNTSTALDGSSSGIGGKQREGKEKQMNTRETDRPNKTNYIISKLAQSLTQRAIT